MFVDEDENTKIVERLDKKLEEYKNHLKVCNQYNVREGINKYTMLIDVLEHIKTGKPLSNDSRNL